MTSHSIPGQHPAQLARTRHSTLHRDSPPHTPCTLDSTLQRPCQHSPLWTICWTPPSTAPCTPFLTTQCTAPWTAHPNQFSDHVLLRICAFHGFRDQTYPYILTISKEKLPKSIALFTIRTSEGKQMHTVATKNRFAVLQALRGSNCSWWIGLMSLCSVSHTEESFTTGAGPGTSGDEPFNLQRSTKQSKNKGTTGGQSGVLHFRLVNRLFWLFFTRRFTGCRLRRRLSLHL